MARRSGGGARNYEKDYELAPIVVVTGVQVESEPILLRTPGPSILKTSKNGKHTPASNTTKHKSTPIDSSPSKQPLIGPELRHNDSIGSLQNKISVNVPLVPVASTTHVCTANSTSITTRVTATIKQPESYLSSPAIVTSTTTIMTPSTVTSIDYRGRTLTTFVGSGVTNTKADRTNTTSTTENQSQIQNNKNNKRVTNPNVKGNER